MKQVYLFLADGFEEIEAISVIDMLRRADISVTTISISDKKQVTGAHQITIEADCMFFDTDFSDGKMLILPGGMPGTTNLRSFAPLKELIQKYNSDKKYIAAICAAPIVLESAGILNGKEATCYPGFEKELSDAIHSNKPVVVSDHVITSSGPGTAFLFALKLIELLKDKNTTSVIAKGMLLA